MSLRRSKSYYNSGGKQRLLDMRVPLHSQPIPETPEQPSEASCVDPLEYGEYWWDGSDDDHSCDSSSTETGTTPPPSVHSDFSPASSWSKDGCFDGDRKSMYWLFFFQLRTKISQTRTELGSPRCETSGPMTLGAAVGMMGIGSGGLHSHHRGGGTSGPPSETLFERTKQRITFGGGLDYMREERA